MEVEALDEPVYVDRAMWEKIVLNLLSNAFKFTLTGGITVRLKRNLGFAELTVTDTGIGIPEAELPRIFERFHRVEGSRGRTFEGTGIGLALARELVKLHGGSIEVHSKQNHGSTFTVSIPFGTAHLPATRGSIGTSHKTPIKRPTYIAEAQACETVGPQSPDSSQTALESINALPLSRRSTVPESLLPMTMRTCAPTLRVSWLQPMKWKPLETDRRPWTQFSESVRTWY